MRIRKWWFLSGLAIYIISVTGMLVGAEPSNKVWLIPIAVGIIFVIASIGSKNKVKKS